MTVAEQEATNQAFLKAALQWLRACLARATPPDKSAASWGWFSRAKATPIFGDGRAGPRAKLDRLMAGEPKPHFTKLAERFDLSPFERDVMLLALAMEIDTGLPALTAAAQGEATKRYPTFALAMSLFDNASWDALSPARPLRGLRLIEVHQAGPVALINAPLRIDERIASYIKGFEYIDDRLSAMVSVLSPALQLPLSQEGVARSLAAWLAMDHPGAVVQLTGPHRAAKTDIVARAAALSGRQALVLRAEALPSQGDDVENWIRLLVREDALSPIVLLVQDVDPQTWTGDDGKSAISRRWAWLLPRLRVPCFVDLLQASPDLEMSPALGINPPSARERKSIWAASLGVPDAPALSLLAAEFEFSGAEIEVLSGRVPPSEADEDERDGARLPRAWSECVGYAGTSIACLTRVIEPRVTLDDVVLPAGEKALLERFVDHARHRRVVTSEFGFTQRGGRGLGVTALFHGESGTGKTLAAEAIAHALGLKLAVIDMATVSSKWVGESEKNWRRIFDAAERGGVVLFIDEADAKFSKRRQEGSSSQEYYINAETDYLLTRTENFSGVGILATNMKNALDSAFIRRLRFIVGFPFPSAAERREIWKKVFPCKDALGELDYDELARVAIPGGSIFNAALAAAHGAAAAEAKIETAHVLDAIHHELRKLDRPSSLAAPRMKAREAAA